MVLEAALQNILKAGNREETVNSGSDLFQPALQ